MPDNLFAHSPTRFIDVEKLSVRKTTGKCLMDIKVRALVTLKFNYRISIIPILVTHYEEPN